MSKLVFRVTEPGQGPRDVAIVEGLTIGRHPENACVLTDPKSSSRHAIVKQESDGSWSIRDLGSSNKTIVEKGPTLEKDQAHVLAPGTKLLIGNTSFEVVLAPTQPMATQMMAAAETIRRTTEPKSVPDHEAETRFSAAKPASKPVGERPASPPAAPAASVAPAPAAAAPAAPATSGDKPAETPKPPSEIPAPAPKPVTVRPPEVPSPAPKPTPAPAPEVPKPQAPSPAVPEVPPATPPVPASPKPEVPAPKPEIQPLPAAPQPLKPDAPPPPKVEPPPVKAEQPVKNSAPEAAVPKPPVEVPPPPPKPKEAPKVSTTNPPEPAGTPPVAKAEKTMAISNESFKGLADIGTFKAARARLVFGNDALRKTVDIDKFEFVIGREAGPEVQCQIDHKAVSGRHARIKYKSQRFFVEDLGSTNHTFIGTEMLAANAERELRQEAHVRFGTFDALFITEIDPSGKKIAPDRYAATLQLLESDGRISKQQRQRIEGDNRAKGDGAHPGETAILSGLVAVDQWCEAFERAKLFAGGQAVMGGKNNSKNLIIAAVVLALVAVIVFLLLKKN